MKRSIKIKTSLSKDVSRRSFIHDFTEFAGNKHDDEDI